MEKTVSNIEVKASAHGDINQSSSCSVENVEIIGPCPVKFVVSCYNKATVESKLVVNESAQAIHEVIVEQHGNTKIWNYFNWNEQTTVIEIENTLNANIENKCTVNQTSFAQVAGVRITTTSNFCAQTIKVYATAGNQANCTLNTVGNILANAETNVEVSQTTGRSSSSGDSSMAGVFFVFIVLFLLAAAVLIFFFRNKKHNRKSDPVSSKIARAYM